MLKRPSGVAARSPLDTRMGPPLPPVKKYTHTHNKGTDSSVSLVIVDYNEDFKLSFAVGICLVKRDS